MKTEVAAVDDRVLSTSWADRFSRSSRIRLRRRYLHQEEMRSTRHACHYRLVSIWSLERVVER